MAELAADTDRRSTPGARLMTAGAYGLVVVLCFLAGYLFLPSPEPDVGRGADLERIRLPEPVPVGDFSLVEIGSGGVYERERLLGQWTLMYFGYSHCPDVCRPTLALLAALRGAMETLPGRSERVETVFVSVDPARDSPEVLRGYLPAGVLGLTGSEREVARLTTQLGIMHLRSEPDASGRYLVDHPATILVIDPSAHLRAGFPFPHDGVALRDQLARIARDFHAPGDGG